jgi:hypothetical protein
MRRIVDAPARTYAYAVNRAGNAAGYFERGTTARPALFAPAP